MSTIAPDTPDMTAERGRRRIEPAYLAMLIPAFLLFTGLLMVPFLTGLFYTFTNFKGYGDWHMIGLSNYISLFRDNIIWESYLFTFKYAIAATILINIIALALALLLNEKIKGQTFWRGLFFLPNILPVLIVSYIFGYLFTNNLPLIGEKLGIEVLSTSLLANEKYAWVAIVFVGVWQAVAYNTIIYLSGLQTIDSSVYEASSIDGASGWKNLLHITLPLIIPFMGINMVLSFKGSLGVFDQVVALTGGGPGTSTQSISYLIFKNGFQGGEYAYQTANGIIYFLIVVFLSLAQLRFFQSQERL
ncbi:carbohydrate ABC transporter membrane protein 1 (CUT1 family) [Luteococcus japonicus]|uniref:Carbohydrate ABC transporter membrane protein 1 (CUT1 family) n=1 Tax=Luteococcus japonicus TaxID=33984 RepID=A0A3N1ZXY9_9ACTN|nr:MULTISPECIES: sugar ABC transporter permease [Luteococcus]MDN5563578.1 sugar ABC transporter permease [Luteococcus sp.]ROR55723.1 carbohydrate ABC transporter membrane protein 1 (CUT1 family) [Luteococcus japonicus]